MRTGEAGRLLVLTAVVCAVAAGTLDAQTVRGHLRVGADGPALAGAWVALLDEGGHLEDETLTDSGGAFSLSAPSAGSYVVLGRAPGFHDAEEPAAVGPGAVLLELTADALPAELPDGRLEPDRRCRLRGDGAARVASLWREVGKALEALVVGEDRGLHGQERLTWTRSLAPDDLHPLQERVGTATAFVEGSPYRSPPAEELAQFGYIQGGDGEGWAFFAPDARTLLSPVFTSSHCLGYDDEGPEPGWVGLTFRPRFGGAMDVEGTLWFDAHTLGPARLDFRYTALPWHVDTDEAGGRVEFRRLEGGLWVVQRWWIRSPRVGVTMVRLTPWDRPRERFAVTSLVEEGGEVLRVRTLEGRIERLEASPADGR